MPGYLDRVLARAFGSGPVLRPRPRSRFEPVHAGPADPLTWPDDPALALAAAPEQAQTEGLVRPDPDPGPMPRAFPGSAPDPLPGPGQARAPEVPPTVAGPKPPEDERAPDLFGIREPTQRSSGDQPPAHLTPPRTHAAAATRARPPSAAAPAVSRTARGPGARPAADLPETEGPAAALRPQPAAPMPDRSPGRAPAEPAGPAGVLAIRHQPSPPAGRQPARRASTSPGEPSPVPLRAPIAKVPVPVARRGTPSSPAEVGPPVWSGSPGAAEPSTRPDPPTIGRHSALAIPSAAARPTRAADPPTDLPTDPSAALGPVVAAPTGKARRYSPRPDVVPAPPVVNVTIGRVEVRPPPVPLPAPPAAVPGPQPLSLAEYLERRSRGPS
jgi:hypothetical protein